uniref:Uncharacterized protein n=1 Tax=Romanomermis culicivorax TaxID=13658 RepID=A0A915IN49_ROMCU
MDKKWTALKGIDHSYFPQGTVRPVQKKCRQVSER